MRHATSLALAGCIGLLALLAGGCRREGGLPERMHLRAAAAPLVNRDVAEGDLRARLGAPSLALASGRQVTWYYEVAEGGAVKLALVKVNDATLHLQDLDSASREEWEQVKARP